MPSSKAEALGVLTHVAEPQDGFITAAQAIEAGIDRPHLHRLLRQGFLERSHRGLYRLVNFPANDDRADLWRAVLWPALDRTDGTLAVLCNGTALSLYDVSTINPRKIEIAVPPSTRFRRNPTSDMRLVRREYRDEDLTRIKGLPVTSLFRTLVDLIAAGSELQFVDEALDVSVSSALLTSKEFKNITALRALDARTISLLRV